MGLDFGEATEDDAAEIAALRSATAARLTKEHGKGHWSSATSVRGVLRGLRESSVLRARQDGVLVATLRLATKKPWAIDVSYFAKAPKALYLLDMAVEPRFQHRGFGRQLLARAEIVARARHYHAIRLDAYDAAAGAGGFYVKCGYREVGRVSYRGTPLIYFERLLESTDAGTPPADSMPLHGAPVRHHATGKAGERACRRG